MRRASSTCSASSTCGNPVFATGLHPLKIALDIASAVKKIHTVGN